MTIFKQHSASIFIAGGVFMSLAAPHALRADSTEFSPKISGEVVFEFQNDYAFASDDPAEEFNSAVLVIDSATTLQLTDTFSFNAGVILDQVQDPAVAGDDRTFDDEGLFVEVLTADYDNGPVRLSGGKMHVNYGIAWDAAPGVYGADLAEEYEMSENIALLGALSHDFGAGGEHTLTAQTFFKDTSFLAESAFTRRERTRQRDGGPGNTGDFSSYALSLDGGEFDALPGLRYHTSFVHLDNETAAAKDERRFALGGAYDISLTDNVTVTPLIEYAFLQDAEGTADQDRHYTTAALGVDYGPWNAAVSGTRKTTDAANGTETDNDLYQVSAGYTFPVGIGVDVAYKRVRNDGVDTDVVGMLVSYAISY